MVTVVRRNNYTCTCVKCNSDLAYSYDEIAEHRINHDYLGDYDVVQGIQCPVCKNIIRHKDGNEKTQ
jgi:uncharacterized protein with PIN domain